ncbi:hypothetical protein [Virgisporangium aurantiacum]|uniref:hypothetical protein n=1 Tax=Virgisporangium aurantiacum TaxID=175570 RepID=UPI00194F6549|nr:hypothetical protein [Virgisporangium aurantiacum]
MRSKDRGRLVPDESGISSLQHAEKLADVFVLDSYLTKMDSRRIDGLDMRGKLEYLTARSRVPRMNPEARDAIANADVIVYWPGTQHSSLFPSYLTDGLAEEREARVAIHVDDWSDGQGRHAVSRMLTWLS